MSGDWCGVHTKAAGVSSNSPQNHSATWLSHKAKTEDLARLTDRNRCDRLARGHREASKRRTHGMIARVVLVQCRLAVDVHPSNGATTTNSQSALWGRVSSIM
jgi:hypothetical protein